MRKAFFVVEMPENCSECRLLHRIATDIIPPINESYHYECSLTHGMRSDERLKIKKPKWCPLKPTPEPMELRGTEGPKEHAYCTGYNECLDENFGGEP